MVLIDLMIGVFIVLYWICEFIDFILFIVFFYLCVFVIEVMGRYCGWFVLFVGIVIGVDFIFIFEDLFKCEDWEMEMCDFL